MNDRLTTAKILCVEDETDLRENIALILQAEGYNTIEASNGKEAYEKFAMHKPSLILCDISMPIMNGYELLEKIHNENAAKLSKTPFVFLTALGQKQNYLKGLKLGADEYIVKPIDFDILLSIIRSKLNKASEQKNATNEKLIQLCSQISNLIPKEIQEPLQNIITLSVTLKKEIDEVNLDKRHADYISKIYLSSLKLNAQILKAFDKSNIVNMVNNVDSYISINTLISQIKKGTSNKNITFKTQDNLPEISLKSHIFVPAIVDYLGRHEVTKAKNLKIDIFLDYLNNLVFSISGNTLLPIASTDLKDVVENVNGSFHTQDNDGTTYNIITFPNFLFKSKPSE